jgi:hypothetical protein
VKATWESRKSSAEKVFVSSFMIAGLVFLFGSSIEAMQLVFGLFDTVAVRGYYFGNFLKCDI